MFTWLYHGPIDYVGSHCIGGVMSSVSGKKDEGMGEGKGPAVQVGIIYLSEP